ncbi:MAG: hypothetical protein KAX30_04465 [Candidatus Atribacteria bacterium]|nr:hypothetical protein [Candidatus Atribacteria bacterium]
MNIYSDKSKCPKCGNADISSAYHKDITKCGWNKPFEGEHIHRHCRNCHYEWPERPLDVEKEE